MGTVPEVHPHIGKLLAFETQVRVALGLVGESLVAVESALLFMDAVAGAHVGRDATLQQPMRNSPLPYVVSAATDSGALPCHCAKRVSMSCAATVS
jgi:hypothetical protein